MAENFIFREFTKLSQAQEWGCFLASHNLVYTIVEKENEYAVLLKKEQQVETEKLLKEHSTSYNLLSYTNQELISYMQQSKETTSREYKLAQDILKIRIKEINTERLKILEEERLQESYKPAKLSVYLYIFAYINAVLGGLFGILLALHIRTYKKTMANGIRLHVYSAEDREQAYTLLGIASIFFICYLCLFIFL